MPARPRDAREGSGTHAALRRTVAPGALGVVTAVLDGGGGRLFSPVHVLFEGQRRAVLTRAVHLERVDGVCVEPPTVGLPCREDMSALLQGLRAHDKAGTGWLRSSELLRVLREGIVETKAAEAAEAGQQTGGEVEQEKLMLEYIRMQQKLGQEVSMDMLKKQTESGKKEEKQSSNAHYSALDEFAQAHHMTPVSLKRAFKRSRRIPTGGWKPAGGSF